MAADPGGRPRLGVLGGTFDPPHVGHLVVAQDVYEALDLDRLLVIPAGDPPHRRALLPAAARHGLVRAAFEGDPRMEVSDLELGREGPSYTVDTLAKIREQRDPEELFLVIGADQLAEFDDWHRPEEIVELATLAVIPRAGREPPESGGGWPFRRVGVTRIDVSASRIRERLRAGRTVRYLVPERIREAVTDVWGRLGS